MVLRNNMASTPGYFPATLSPSKEKKFLIHTSELIRLYLPTPLPSLLKALTLPPKTFCPHHNNPWGMQLGIRYSITGYGCLHVDLIHLDNVPV